MSPTMSPRQHHECFQRACLELLWLHSGNVTVNDSFQNMTRRISSGNSHEITPQFPRRGTYELHRATMTISRAALSSIIPYSSQNHSRLRNGKFPCAFEHNSRSSLVDPNPLGWSKEVNTPLGPKHALANRKDHVTRSIFLLESTATLVGPT